jgi:hypothetical protein
MKTQRLLMTFEEESERLRILIREPDTLEWLNVDLLALSFARIGPCDDGHCNSVFHLDFELRARHDSAFDSEEEARDFLDRCVIEER